MDPARDQPGPGVGQCLRTQFAKGDLQGDVLRALQTYGLPAELLELELTESLLMSNTEPTTAILENLKAAGVQISIDDFGTGYSRLAYLRRFPIDKLKIDDSFTQEISDRRQTAPRAGT